MYRPLTENTTIYAEYSDMMDAENVTTTTLPQAAAADVVLAFSDQALVGIIVYACVFVIAAVGNLTVFVSLLRSRRRKSRIQLMIAHLTAADLIVTFIMIPMEICWRVTVQWLAGNAVCKAMVYLRAFGLYLSSNVLVCISLDRYFAILHPLRLSHARSRGKMMLASAWIASFICAMPQSFIFHTAVHPQYANFTQCVSFGFFRTQSTETAYNFACVFFMYFLPLAVIVITYPAIWWEIHQKSSKKRDSGSDETQLRRSDDRAIDRARIRTLRMTIMIVAVFVICWTPYVVITLWYMFSRDSAEKIQPWQQEILFMMAVSNSCMNPIVYGSYVIDCRTSLCAITAPKTPISGQSHRIHNNHSNLPTTSGDRTTTQRNAPPFTDSSSSNTPLSHHSQTIGQRYARSALELRSNPHTMHAEYVPLATYTCPRPLKLHDYCMSHSTSARMVED